MNWRPAPLSMPPQLGYGGGMPKPRKLSDASARITVPIPAAKKITTPHIISGINVMIATVVLVMNVVVDITYAWLDPRIRYT